MNSQKLLTVTQPTGSDARAIEHPAVQGYLENGWSIVSVTPIGIEASDVAAFVLVIEKA